MRSSAAVVVLYGRPDCHLCDEARAAIHSLQAELGGIELREVDIDGDDRLLAEYLERIPVVELDGDEISELTFDPHELRRRLHTVGP